MRLPTSLILLFMLFLSNAKTEVSGEEEKSEECAEHESDADIVLVLFFMLLVGIFTRYALMKVPVPYTALLLIAGLLLGGAQIGLTSKNHFLSEGENETHETLVPEESVEGDNHEGEAVAEAPTTANEATHSDEMQLDVEGHEKWEKFARGIDAWQSLDPELLLLVFLPALIFSSAFSLNFHITKKSFGQVLMLAGPGVVIGTILTAFFVKHAFPYNWCWPKAFMFGAMISATDPVAVVALLKEVGASQRLGTVIEGESLFNDGTAFVFFLLFRDMIPNTADCLNDEYNCKGVENEGKCVDGHFTPTTCLEDRSVGESIGFFLQLALGGPAIGIAFGIAATIWLQYIYNDLLTEISVTLVSAYLTFYVAEDVAEVSGVLAVVSLGLFMGSFAKDRISSSVHEPMHVFWEMMEYLANTLIFVYTGLKISVEIFDSTNPNSKFIDSREWGLAFLLFAALQVIRFLTIFSLLPILSRMGYGMTWKDALVAVWGGLRGAVGLALALIVQLDVDNIPPSFRSYTIFYLGFVVMATLLVNGTTMPYLLRYLGITESSPEKLEVLLHLLNEIEDIGKQHEMSGGDELLGDPDYEKIEQLTSLNIEKVVPKASEVRNIMSSARVSQRPSVISIQHGLSQRNISRWSSLNRNNLGQIMENVDLDGQDRRVTIGEHNKTWLERAREFIAYRWIKRKSKIPDAPRKTTYTPDMLVQDLRFRLLQVTKTAYAEWLEKGYINAKAMFDLIEAADKAVDNLDRPICDWHYLEKSAQPSKWRIELQKLKGFSCAGPLGRFVSTEISKVLFKTMLYSVLLARTFVAAHCEAEHTLHEKIKSEMGEDDAMSMHLLESSVEMVLRESRESTKAAYELMRDFKLVYPEILRAIKTRISAQKILLEKQEYVEQIERAGLIENREATAIREMIDAKLKSLIYGSLQADLPDSQDLLHTHALFISMPRNLFDSQVWPHAKPKVFTKGENIFSIGGEPHHVTIVLRGLVKMVDSSGREEPIGDGFGSVLGVSEIMLNRPRSITMLCETPTEVIQIDKTAFLSMVERFMSIRVRSWQLTGMVLTYLNPWGNFKNSSILELGTTFKKAQLLEFEEGQELRVRTRSYLISGSVSEGGFSQSHQTIVGPAPLGPGLGIYNCNTQCKVLRIPQNEDGGEESSKVFRGSKKLLARSSVSLSRLSMPLNPVRHTQSGKSGLTEIPEAESSSEREVTQGPTLYSISTSNLDTLGRRSWNPSHSADLEMRSELASQVKRSFEL